MFTEGKKYCKNYKLPLIFNEFNEIKNINQQYNCFVIMLIEEGNGIISINSKEYMLLPPQIIWLREKDIVIEVKTSNLKIKCICFYPLIINEKFNFENILDEENFSDIDKLDLFFIAPFINKNIKISRLISDYYINMKNIFEKIHGILCNQNDEYWPCRGRTAFIELLFQINTLIENSERTKDANALIQQETSNEMIEVLSYINSNFNSDIKISDITRKIGINRTSLYNKFREATGMTIIGYLISIRLQMACFMLKGTKLPISEVMYNSGFNNYTNFIKQFKKHFMISPKEFRERFQHNDMNS